MPEPISWCNAPPPSIKRPFRVYPASGSSQRLTIARHWIERLHDRGIEVYDWTRDPNWDLGRMPTEDEFVESARRDEVAIYQCDLFWYLVPEEKSEGAASELALARALGKRIVASGEFGARNIFALLVPSEMRFSSHETAFLAVCNIAKDFRSFRGEF
jgi:hypothetical protein